jgi:NADPH-dependent glutamate synthase beta subunit-like oxidoreductase
VPPWRDTRIAIVGSGPAGLSVAYNLARLGHPVTIFEAAGELGGVLRTGIPEYRLPRDVLDQEISYILRHGVEVRTKAPVSRADLLRLTEKFAAVFVGTGLQQPRALDLGPCADGVVLDGIDFLDRARRQAIKLRGQNVVVVGGGNTAVDASRSALRLGARRVQMLYRRTRAEMPAIPGEIEEALSEGIELAELVAPLRLCASGAGALLTCQHMQLGEPDESGRRRPVPQASEDACFDLPCDCVILAVGQAQDLTIWPEGAEISEGRNLIGLARAPIFAGGDFASGEGTVAAAIGSGRRAALHIHCTLTGEDLFPAPSGEPASPEHMTLHVFAHAPQERGHRVRPQWRRRRFSEVHLGLVDEPGHHQVEIEARRCLSCGVCNGCDRCVNWCPEGVVVRGPDGYCFDYDYCKGCGLCAAQCPRGVIYMAEM